MKKFDIKNLDEFIKMSTKSIDEFIEMTKAAHELSRSNDEFTNLGKYHQEAMKNTQYNEFYWEAVKRSQEGEL